MIDQDGFRANVGIVLANAAGQVFWARRIGRAGWQFPQGGIESGETPEATLYRELGEEVGLAPDSVELIDSTREWLRYRLPEPFQRHGVEPRCVGQKQIWFLLRLRGDDSLVRLDASGDPVLFFATLRDCAGTRSMELDIPSGLTIQGLKDRISSEFPSLKESMSSVLITINREYAFDDAVIPENAELAMFPPVSGGSSHWTRCV